MYTWFFGNLNKEIKSEYDLCNEILILLISNPKLINFQNLLNKFEDLKLKIEKVLIELPNIYKEMPEYILIGKNHWLKIHGVQKIPNNFLKEVNDNLIAKCNNLKIELNKSSFVYDAVASTIEAISQTLEGLKNKYMELICQYSYLRYVGLSILEFKFCAMKEREDLKLYHKFDKIEVVLDLNLNFIILKKRNVFSEHIILGTETGNNPKTLQKWVKHIKLILKIKYKNGEAQFSKSINELKDVYTAEITALKKFEGYYTAEGDLFTLFCIFNNSIGITDRDGKGNWEETNVIQLWFKRQGNDYVYHGFPTTPGSVNIKNLN